MEKKQFLFSFFILILLVVTGLTYYRNMVLYDYEVIESELEEMEAVQEATEEIAPASSATTE